MTIREALKLSAEFEAFSDMIDRIKSFETNDEILKDRLSEAVVSIGEARRYMMEMTGSSNR
jgi:hypothetical protein